MQEERLVLDHPLGELSAEARCFGHCRPRCSDLFLREGRVHAVARCQAKDRRRGRCHLQDNIPEPLQEPRKFISRCLRPVLRRPAEGGAETRAVVKGLAFPRPPRREWRGAAGQSLLQADTPLAVLVLVAGVAVRLGFRPKAELLQTQCRPFRDFVGPCPGESHDGGPPTFERE